MRKITILLFAVVMIGSCSLIGAAEVPTAREFLVALDEKIEGISNQAKADFYLRSEREADEKRQSLQRAEAPEVYLRVNQLAQRLGVANAQIHITRKNYTPANAGGVVWISLTLVQESSEAVLLGTLAHELSHKPSDSMELWIVEKNNLPHRQEIVTLIEQRADIAGEILLRKANLDGGFVGESIRYFDSIGAFAGIKDTVPTRLAALSTN